MIRKLTAIALVTAASVLACNAIIGVEDVKAKVGGSRLDSGASSSGAGDDDDITRDDSGGSDFDDGQHPSLALGFNHGCARMLDSTVRCWGDNGAGQLGDGTDLSAPSGPSLRPKNVPNVTDAVAVAAGLSHTCIVHATGRVSCFGVNTFGQLGDGTTDRTSTPVEVKNITNAKTIAGGNSTTCALLEDKTVMCWGYNGSGNLGDGTTKASGIPVKVKNLSSAIAVAAAADHTCAIVDGGRLFCWGGNETGQLGIGSLDPAPDPTEIKGLSNVEQVATAQDFSCARDKSGRVYCWGANAKGQLGNGAATEAPNPSPGLVSGVTDAKWIWAGFEHACAVRETGAVVCWGFAGQGQLGEGPVDADLTSPTPVTVKGLTTARRVYTGGDRTCAVTSDNKGLCWGANTLGQLGNGTTDRAYTPTPISDFK
jgi:alpha-tubulin suppressor-like RCC1 family protein